MFTSAFANAGVPQNFTNDRARLLAAINQSFAVALHNPPNGPAHDPRNGNLVMIDDPEGYESGDCHCRVCVPETIGRIADAVRDVQGRRKTLIFVGTYFRRTNHCAARNPGRDLNSSRALEESRSSIRVSVLLR